MTYQIKLEKFEGPFDLLLDLIEKKKLSINELSLAQIADQYLDHLKQIEKFPTREVAIFIVVAGTLMVIKSRSLIPTLKISQEEEEDIADLENRLRQCKQYRALARSLEKIFGKKIIFGREAYVQVEPVFVEPKDATISKIKEVMEALLNNLPQPITQNQIPQTLVKKTISLEQKIEELIKRIENKVKICFSDIKKDPACQKIDLIVSFLALLELTKRGLILIEQNQNFGEIEIAKR